MTRENYAKENAKENAEEISQKKLHRRMANFRFPGSGFYGTSDKILGASGHSRGVCNHTCLC